MNQRALALVAFLLVASVLNWSTVYSLAVPGDRQDGAATGVIAGAVLDRSSGLAIDGAVVLLRSRALDSARRQTTDSQGRYRFGALAAGEYYLSATAIGYLGGSYGRTTPQLGPGPASPSVVRLRTGELFSSASVYLTRPASISGTVRASSGQPVVGAYVRSLILVTVSGRPQWVAGPVAKADDRGLFRIGSLPKGDYKVVITSGRSTSATGRDSHVADPASARSSTVLYYGDSRNLAGATTISLEAGDERTGVDVSLTSAPGRRIAGRLVAPADARYWTIVKLFPAGDEGLCAGAEAASVVPRADGSFEFHNVPPGEYVIRALDALCSVGLPNSLGLPVPARFEVSAATVEMDGLYIDIRTAAERRKDDRGVEGLFRQENPHWGEARVMLDERDARDVTDLVVTMQRVVRISGTVVDSDGLPMARTVLTADAADGDASRGRPQSESAESGAFVLDGLWPGRYFVRLMTKSSMVIDAITWGGRDYSDRPFDINGSADVTGAVVKVSRGGSVVGIVRDARENPVASGMVMYFPADALQWTDFGFTSPRLGRVITDSHGTYRVPGLPAGDYLLASLHGDDSAVGAWQRPEFLRGVVAYATKLRVRPGVTYTLDLHLLATAR